MSCFSCFSNRRKDASKVEIDNGARSSGVSRFFSLSVDSAFFLNFFLVGFRSMRVKQCVEFAGGKGKANSDDIGTCFNAFFKKIFVQKFGNSLFTFVDKVGFFFFNFKKLGLFDPHYFAVIVIFEVVVTVVIVDVIFFFPVFLWF